MKPEEVLAVSDMIKGHPMDDKLCDECHRPFIGQAGQTTCIQCLISPRSKRDHKPIPEESEMLISNGPMRKISCAKCDRNFESNAKNVKYCPECRTTPKEVEDTLADPETLLLKGLDVGAESQPTIRALAEKILVVAGCDSVTLEYPGCIVEIQRK